MIFQEPSAALDPCFTAGEHIAETLREHTVPGEITVQCLEGRFQMQTSLGAQTMQAGDWVHLAGNEPHALVAEEDCSALVTICLQG